MVLMSPKNQKKIAIHRIFIENLLKSVIRHEIGREIRKEPNKKNKNDYRWILIIKMNKYT